MVKKLSCVSCGSLKRFPHTFTIATQTNIKHFIFCQCPSTFSFMTSNYPYIVYVYCFYVVDCYTNNLYKEDCDYLVTKLIKQMQKSNKL